MKSDVSEFPYLAVKVFLLLKAWELQENLLWAPYKSKAGVMHSVNLILFSRPVPTFSQPFSYHPHGDIEGRDTCDYVSSKVDTWALEAACPGLMSQLCHSVTFYKLTSLGLSFSCLSFSC